MNINENIRVIRIEKGIKQSVIADCLDCDVSTISNIELGKREVKVNELEKIANALGVSVVDLLMWPVKYVPAHKEEDKIRTLLQIELTDKKREEVLKILFGDKDIKILNMND